MRNKTIVYIYNSFRDPLFQNLMFQYIQSLSKMGAEFYLITFEQPAYEISPTEIKQLKISLKKKGIHWKPLKHRTGSFLLLKKLFDLLSAFFVILKWRLFGGAKNIFAFANVSASHSVIYSSLLSLKLFIYSYEPHAAFQVELGLWPSNSLKFKLLNFFERLAAKKASIIFTGTKYGVELVHSIKSTTPVYRLPTSVDETLFYYKKEHALSWREKHQLENNKVVLYIGKFGDLYYEPKKLITFYEALYELDPSYYFVIVTSFELEQIESLLTESSIPRSSFYLDTNISYEDVKVLISAADVGMSIVPPFENQKYRSPTKVAEYLLCGLPYVTCEGVSEDDDIAKANRVGAVIPSLEPQYAEIVHVSLNNWLTEREALRERCRETGIIYRGKSNVDYLFKEVLLPKLISGE